MCGSIGDHQGAWWLKEGGVEAAGGWGRLGRVGRLEQVLKEGL